MKSDGDITFRDTAHKDTGIAQEKTYAFKTPGRIENQGPMAFHDLVIEAQQLHNNGILIVRGTLTGTIQDFSVGENHHVVVNTLSFSPMQNFHLGTHARLHSPHPFCLDVVQLYENKGVLSSSQKVSLKVSESTDDLGLVIATDEIELLFKKKLELHEPILDMAPTGKVYKASFRTKTKVTHCDYYLNTITDHYIVTEDLLGKEVSRTYSHRTETGYLFQERKTLVKENEETMTPGIFAWLAAQDSVFQEPHIPSAPGTSVPEIKDLLEKIEKRG